MKGLMICCIIFLSSLTYGQHRWKGQVQDQHGKGIPEVVLRSNKFGELGATDREGNFNIILPKLPFVVYSSKVGYMTDTLLIVDEVPVNIVLKKATIQLEEAVVYSDGFQQLPRERATGSFEQLNGSLLKRRVSSNILGQLDGLATGLQFDNRNKSPQLNIRGMNSFLGGIISPLIVVDNFPFEGDINQLNPNDVESVTLLKDAAATSIWGARAGNGVIVITTKKASNKFRVDFSTNWTLQTPEDLYYDPIVKSTDFIDVERMLFERGHYDNLFSNPLTLRKTVLSPVVDLLQKVRTGEMDRSKADLIMDGWRNNDVRKDREKFYRWGSLQQHYLRLNTGTAMSDHSLSVGWDKSIGNEILKHSDRITLRQNNTLRLNKKLSLQANFAYTATQNISSAGITNFVYYPYTRIFDENGNPLSIPYQLNQNYVDTVGKGNLYDWSFNPYTDLQQSKTKTSLNHLAVNLTAQYQLLAGLNAQLIYGLENQQIHGNNFYREDSYFVRDLVNRFTQVNNGGVKRNLPAGAIEDRSYSNLIGHRVRGQINFAKTWYEQHEFNMLLGAELSNRTIQGNSYRNYGVDPNVLTVQKVDYVNAYPTFDNLYGNSYIPYYGSNSKYIQRFVSVFANAAYTLRQKYTWTASMRKDGSNVFGAVANNRWNPLWSTGLSWIVSKEGFMQNFHWLNSLKLRSTFGTSGNLANGANRDPIMLYVGTAPFTNYPYGLINTPPNPYLKWEEVRTWNNGIDFAVLGNRISGSFEWFDKWSIDLIAPDELDPTTGFLTADRNIGEIRGKGFDAKIDVTSSLGSPLQWKITVGLSHAKSTVTKFNGTLSSTQNYAESGPRALNPILQKELYPVFAYRFAGLDPQNGDPQGYLNGEISKDYQKLLNDSLQNLHYYGSALPRYYGFFRGMLSYKGIQLTFSVNYKFGHYFRNRTIGYNGLFDGAAAHGDYYKRWQNPGDENYTTVPSLVYPGNGNRDNFYKYAEPNVLKGDVVRLQDIGLRYAFPKFPAQLTASINNVGILWRANKKGVDPDYFTIPPGRIYSLGININL